ncbi:MAG TPA: hypothetical protein VND45_05205 [Thermoanaerobaculia bacterium]|nr:hypothetical protein [Thermoanaerobaculia bacterium]
MRKNASALLAGLTLLTGTARALADTVQSPLGGSYSFTSAGTVESVENDDGTLVEVATDASGQAKTMTVTVNGGALQLQYSAGARAGWIQAGALPMLFCTEDAAGRTTGATLYSNMWLENGEWYLDANGPDPIYAASLAYGASGHVASITLNNGLSLQLQPTETGTVQQTLFGADGTVLATATPIGDTTGVRDLPAHLDPVATQLGLGADWAETLTFGVTPSGHLTTARNASGTVVLYLVDVGPFRVGYTPEGVALFYDFMPNYDSGVFDDPAARQMTGVVPTHIVMTGAGAAGMYDNGPATGAIYGAWVDGSDVPHVATLQPASSNVRSDGSGRKIGSNGYRFITTVVCAGGQCWTHTYIEWVDEPTVYSGGTPSTPTPPASGGKSGSAPGNHVNGPLKAAVDRGLKNAENKLKKEQCLALFNRVGIDQKKLIDVMHEREFTDPAAYLTKALRYSDGNGAEQCPGSTQASTKVGKTQVAICRSFGNASTGMAGVYLIHEMMHTLGYGESPQMKGYPNTQQINEAVIAACGNN